MVFFLTIEIYTTITMYSELYAFQISEQITYFENQQLQRVPTDEKMWHEMKNNSGNNNNVTML